MRQNIRLAMLIGGFIIIILSTAMPTGLAAPRIVHHPQSVSAGTPLKINVTVIDNVEIEGVRLNYRHMGDKENSSLDMKRVKGNDTEAVYEAVLPENEVTEGYIFYSFNITDAGGSTTTQTYTTSVTERVKNGGQLGVFIMAMVVAVIFIILEIGFKYRYI